MIFRDLYDSGIFHVITKQYSKASHGKSIHCEFAVLNSQVQAILKL